MESYPRDELALNAFADVHYFFSDPSARPLQHRFDKGSHVLLHRNAAERKGRLEIANNVGNPDQDILVGVLSRVRLEHSLNHPCFVSLIVCKPGVEGNYIEHDGRGQQWSLRDADHRNGGQSLFEIKALDIYFWKPEDAMTFSRAFNSLHGHGQLNTSIDSAKSAEPDPMSPVVQRLEEAVISEDYRPEAFGTASAKSDFDTYGHTTAGTVAPAGATSPAQGMSFAPMAYNPAAPAAPEPIREREMTPPPTDGSDGTGLMAVAVNEEGQVPLPTFAPPPIQHSATLPQISQPYSHPVWQSSQQTAEQAIPSAQSTNFQSPRFMQYGQLERTPSFPPPPPPPSAVPANVPSASPQHYHETHAQQIPALYGQTRSASQGVPFSQPPQQSRSPSYAIYPEQHTSIYGQSLPLTPMSPGFASAPAQSPPPVGSNQAQQAPAGLDNPYNVHSQVYVPTEAELKSHGGKPKTPKAGPGQQPGKLEQRAERLEKGVNRFFKKLEKRGV
ncbi:hypothetical protein L228DRAFT_242705 [Xylona heveae TC161]|uniref:Uncharacterized protein n=1 Tax=Xylona heveae (strain CBS 132557 / TC161) TaxID=1328760 RepID=A0A165JHZ9_XYLHT|nr:hypothetical protein L228DRAFT_242705 [Xylona heveae TC161]KZF26263.1 hypothetical protein L228DRAFT_242705 [Xylona heveae TC161]